MSWDEVEQLIDKKIRLYEIRVAVISGVVGGFFTFGIIHAIWILKNRI